MQRRDALKVFAGFAVAAGLPAVASSPKLGEYHIGVDSGDAGVTATALVRNGEIVSITFMSAGSGYKAPPEIVAPCI